MHEAIAVLSVFTVKQGPVPSDDPGQWSEYLPDITAFNLRSPKFYVVNVKIIYSPEKSDSRYELSCFSVMDGQLKGL
jgi:hypothetical protein